MPTNRKCCGNVRPRALRKREHKIWFEDNTTGVCNIGKRAERRMSDRLTSYCKAILEEQYGLISGKEDEKIKTYIVKEVYPYGKKHDNQLTVTVQNYDTVAQDLTNGTSYTETQYREYLSARPTYATGYSFTNVAVLESDRVTHGHEQFSHTPITDDDDMFSMLATTWKHDLFTTTFEVVENYTADPTQTAQGGPPGVPVNQTYQSGIEVTIELKRDYHFFYDIWRFKSMTIRDYTGADANNQPLFVQEFFEAVNANTKEWGVAKDKVKYTKSVNPSK